MNRGEILVMKKFVVVAFALMLIAPMVSAGVGISWDRESSLVPENTKTCLTYKVYNPWPEDSYAQIILSEELEEIIKSSDAQTQFIPKDTSSSEAIPLTFCFKTPRIYEQDCLIGESMICKQDCNEDMKVYEGEVQVVELSEEQAKISGAGGSATTTSVSAPLRIRVQCVPHARNYTVVYLFVAVVAAILLVINLIRGKKKKTKKK